MIIAETSTTLGPIIGLIVIGLVIWYFRSRSDTLTRECPHCKRRMRGDASVCPHCNRESEAWVLNDGVYWRHDEAGEWEYRRPTGDGGHRWVKR